jgi:hypothetical protein
LKKEKFDEFIQQLDKNLESFPRVNLADKLEDLIEAQNGGATNERRKEEATNSSPHTTNEGKATISSIQVPIFIDFGASGETIMVDLQNDTVKSLKHKLISVGRVVTMEDIFFIILEI